MSNIDDLEWLRGFRSRGENYRRTMNDQKTKDAKELSENLKRALEEYSSLKKPRSTQSRLSTSDAPRAPEPTSARRIKIHKKTGE